MDDELRTREESKAKDEAHTRSLEVTQSSRDELARAASEEKGGDSPDVLLDVPLVKVDEIDLEVERLRARVALNAELANMLRISVGADVEIGEVELTIKGVEAQAMLKARLDNVHRILSRTLDTVDRNPRLMQKLLQPVGEAGQALSDGSDGGFLESLRGHADELRQLAGDVLDSAGQRVSDFFGLGGESGGEQEVDSAGEPGDLTGFVLSESGRGDRTIRRVLDAFGDILEVTLDSSGEVEDERIVGSLNELQVIEEEHRDGKLHRRIRDESGCVIRQVLDPQGHLLSLSIEEGTARGRWTH